MKKIVKRIFLVLLVVVTAYTAAATVLVHGVSVYRLNSRLGAVLAISRQVTLLAAVVLWIAALILLGRWIAARRKSRAQAKFPAGAAVQAGPAKGRKNRKKLMGKPAAAADKIPPRGVAAPQPAPSTEEGIPPRRGTMPMPAGAPAGSPDGPTMPMPVGSPTGPTMPMPAGEPGGPTMPMPAGAPAGSPAGATVPMPGQEEQSPAPVSAPGGEAAPRTGADVTPAKKKAPDAAAGNAGPKLPASGSICPRCGSMVRAGAKFCTKCGCRLEVQV